MIKTIDTFLNKITMYRVVLYSLIVIALAAVVLASFGLLPFNPLMLIFSALLFILVCLIANSIFGWAFGVYTNVESVYITALILFLIVTPLQSMRDMQFFSMAVWASVLAMATKYMLAIRKKHVFNPAAIAVVITAFVFNQAASWWVGTLPMLPFVLIFGLLVVRKIRRLDLVISFLVVGIVSTIAAHFNGISSIIPTTWTILAFTPILFFAFIMLTEPATTPLTRRLRIAYGILVGVLVTPAIHIGTIYSTPELALVVGNIFSYLVSPKERLVLKLKQKMKVANDTYSFVFHPDRKIFFKPGQYLEWTVPGRGADSRGNRRYFTIASSPTEPDVMIGVKFYPEPSSFKKNLLALNPNDMIVASERAGDFTLPKDKNKKLVFIAGGIGVTPFRSMIKYLLDKQEKRDIVMFYSNKTLGDVAYTDILDKAHDQLNIKMVYTLTDTQTIPPTWRGERGFIDAPMIERHVVDYKERYFYLSGPHVMVTAFEGILKTMGIPKSHIKKDFFPGFA